MNLFNQGLGHDWTAAEVSKSSNERKLEPARCLASSINAPSPDQEKSIRLLGHTVEEIKTLEGWILLAALPVPSMLHLLVKKNRQDFLDIQ